MKRGVDRVVVLVLLASACGSGPSSDDSAGVEARVAGRARLDQTVWAPELQAGEYERTLVAFWARLLDADRRGAPEDKREIFAGIAFSSLTIGSPGPAERLDHGIDRSDLSAAPRTLDAEGWNGLVDELWRGGLRLVRAFPSRLALARVASDHLPVFVEVDLAPESGAS